ncbi:MAG: hypothetical protein K9J83_01385 [Desulfarculaceae bacterium]|nr:hypothetical protein [Desulfarculaceae bacterium]
MNLIDKALICKLKEKGIEESLVPGFLRTLANALMINPSMSSLQLNHRLKYLGWDDVELDWRTMELARAFFEAKGISTLEYRPAPWYVNNNGSEVNAV